METTSVFGGQLLDLVERRGRPRIEWTSEMDALLGTMLDKDLATRLGISSATVQQRRRSLGVAPVRSVNWTLERVRGLSKYHTPQDAASGEGVSRQWLYYVLKKHGVDVPTHWRHLNVGDTFKRNGRKYVVLDTRKVEGTHETQIQCSCTRIFWSTNLSRHLKCGECTRLDRWHRGKGDPLIGRRNGRLTIIERVSTFRIKVRCECGTEKVIGRQNFKRTLSCGCLRVEYWNRGKADRK